MARAIDDACKARRTRSGQGEFTNRDIARRLAEIGHPITHVEVMRLRRGKRRITMRDWLAISAVLSVPPLSLVRDSAGLSIGARTADQVRDFITGTRPTSTVDVALYHSTPVRGGKVEGSEFAAVLRGLADAYDASRGKERLQVLATILAHASGTLNANLTFGGRR